MRKIITLKDFRKLINSKSLDKYKDLPVVYAKDDESNGFDRVLFSPGVIDDVEIYNDTGVKFKQAVCIN